MVNNRIKLASITLTYPRLFNFGGTSNFIFSMPASNAQKYLEISGFSFTGVPVLYDLTNGRRYLCDVSNPSVVKVNLLSSASATDLVLVSEAAANLKTVGALETRNFINYQSSANQGDYLIITHSAILVGPNGTNPVDDYRAYRSSTAGGAYNAKVYMIDQLTDQFAFGIKNSPLAIRDFARMARNTYSQTPKMIFIAGRGVKYVSARNNESLLTTARLNLVPTFGEPASDVLLTAEGSSSIPLTPIGRVPAVNGNELAIYLDKVKQYETQYQAAPGFEASAWKKNAIHMIGANDQSTIDLLYDYLNRDKLTIQDTLYGAHVTDFVNTLSIGNEESTAERLRALMNGGVNLLTYFGHSTSEKLVFNLENPDNYTNQGKYPVFHMMGCNTGDIFILSESRLSNISTISEKYIFAKDRGCIGMMAGTSLGYVYPLQEYNNELYRLIAKDGYRKTLGELMQKTIANSFAAFGGENDLFLRAQNEEFTLNGDPAIKLYQFDKPDYIIEDDMVLVNPGIVSVADENFTIKAKFANLGKAINKNLVVELKRTYPDMSVKIVRRDTISGLRYMDSISYQINIDPLIDKGSNKFTITIDPENLVDELFESNNSITREVFIYQDDIKPVYPYDYAIINQQNLVFAASTGNPFAETRNYQIEIDTTKQFNSPAKVSQTKTSAGGLVEFNPTIHLRDSTVYYWRVSGQPSSANEQPVWSDASFTYIPGNRIGFSESHWDQFKGDAHEGLNLDRYPGTFVFDSLKGLFTVTNGIYQYNLNVGARDMALYIGDVFVQGGFSGPQEPNSNQNALRFYMLDNKTLSPVKNEIQGSKGKYGSYPPVEWRPGYTIPGFFQFDISTPTSRKTVMQFLDSIPTNYYVAMTSNQIIGTILPSVWQSDTAVYGKNQSLYHKLKAIGFSKIDSIKSEVSYVLVYQKGNANVMAQEVGKTIDDKLVVPVIAHLGGIKGVMKSPVFANAKTWNALEWDGASLESPSTDEGTIDIWGVTHNGSEIPLMNGISIDQKQVDLSSVNTNTYPGLRIVLNNIDNANRSPYQLKYWRLYGTPVAEGVIAPNLYFNAKDTMEVGEPYSLGVGFKNVSKQNFDSLSLKLSVRNDKNVETIIPMGKVKPLVSGDTVRVNVNLDTKTFAGSNLAFLEVNPEGNSHQPEQYKFNNFISKNFYVWTDSTSPFMDVTFDGLHILNKDIVSSKPDIIIKLTDDARFMLLNNTELVKVQLRYPSGVLRDYAFNNDTLVLTPPNTGGNNANTATINFKPNLLEDGEYELVVNGKDQSGNKAGSLNYRVAFQVINKAMISDMLNYPNPFTSSTAFVFTLTGSEVPQNLRIQVLTITGKIVKEITKAELGPIHIGRNITEYKWDGTDQYGQKLANGVYLYRVLTNLNGKSLDKYSTSENNTDRYFKKGYGKMVLIR